MPETSDRSPGLIKAEACDKRYVSASLERARLRFERLIRVE